MERVGINTAQNVAIDYQLASIGDRILATLLDYVFFIAYFILILFFASFNIWPGKNESIAFWIITYLPILFYDLLCELLMGGQSFGKQIMKTKVIKLDGSSPGFGGYLLRWLFRIVDTIGFSGAVALITILVNGKGQRVGDIAAGTTVIKLAKKLTLKDTILNKVNSNYKIMFNEVEHLSDKDIFVIKNSLTYGLKHNKWDVIDKASNKVRETLNIKTDLKAIPFLNTIIKDYTHFQFKE
ncbi:MAG: RDD family protein [Flavobacteriales bacterium]|nr:RDD family protein [Flavobacteriales bacterium]